jgi:hypothetical protein
MLPIASKVGFVACGIKRTDQICGRRSEGTYLATEGAIGGNDRPGRRGPPYKARGFQGAADSHPCIGATGLLASIGLPMVFWA